MVQKRVSGADIGTKLEKKCLKPDAPKVGSMHFSVEICVVLSQEDQTQGIVQHARYRERRA